MRNKITLLNVSSSIVMQIASFISAIVVPRIVLKYFGSNINGLIASISQFLNYIALVEGGITGVIAANLYRPLVEHDSQRLSSVLSTAKKIYFKIGIIFLCYSFTIACFYPLLIQTDLSKIFVFALTIVLSAGVFFQYMFSILYITLLNADKKIFIVSYTSTIIIIINLVLTVVLIEIYPNILFIKLGGAILFAFQPLVLSTYIKHHYQVNWNTMQDDELISQRWSGFAINIAYFIHSSTDITLLTLFVDLRTVSVYSIYSLIISKMSTILHSVATAFEPTIGQAYAKNDITELNKKMDLYEFIIFFSVGVIFTVMGMLISPFVIIYTSNINDTNYYRPGFGWLMVLAEAVYLLRLPHVSLAYSANQFKKITASAYIEAIINILFSIVLVNNFGLSGIAIGTVFAMSYRTIFHIDFTSKLVPSRKKNKYYGRLLKACIASFVSIFICVTFFPINQYTLFTWLGYATLYTVISSLVFLLTALFFFRSELIDIKDYIKQK